MSALIGVATFMAISPGTASAARGNYRCDRGEFCLGQFYHLTGGVYDNPGSDADLRNDRYTYYSDPTKNPFVAYASRGNSWSAHNNGNRFDVMVYTWPGYTGYKACIVRGRKLDLPSDWKDRIMSFRWITRSECNASGRLL